MFTVDAKSFSATNVPHLYSVLSCFTKVSKKRILHYMYYNNIMLTFPVYLVWKNIWYSNTSIYWYLSTLNLRYHDLFLRCDLTSLLIILILNCSALLVFDYCNNVLMIRANDARFLFCNLRCVELYFVTKTHIHTYTHDSLTYHQALMKPSNLQLKLGTRKINVWRWVLDMSENWQKIIGHFLETNELQWICKIYPCKVSFSRNSMKQEMNCTPYL